MIHKKNNSSFFELLVTQIRQFAQSVTVTLSQKISLG